MMVKAALNLCENPYTVHRMAVRFPILYITEPDAEAAVLSSGVLAYLVGAMPQARFTVIGSPETAPLFADLPKLDRLLVLDKDGPLEWIALWNQVRETKWGLVVDMRGSSLSGKLQRGKRAVRGKPTPGLHAVEQAAKVLQLDEVPAPRLFVSEETRKAADALVKPDGKPILAVGPGTDWIGKCWPAERYSKIAAAFLAPDGPLAGGRLLILGEEADRDLVHTIRLSVARNRVIEANGRLTPLQAVAALSHASLYIGADSLWTQLAVAAGVPCVGVYGPSDEAEVGPWGGISVRGPRSLAEYRELDPRLNQAIQHMMDLPAERVLKAARKMLAERAVTP
jgi:heptosyltransferase-3